MKDKHEQTEQDLFGVAVRQRRLQLGVTLDQLAENSGVSAAALSRLERGMLSPSLRNALAIARGLGCDLSELIEQAPTEVTRAGENLRFVDEETGIVRLALARPGPDLELLSYSVPPGASSARFSAHKSGSREIFHLIAGRLEVHAGDQVVVLDAGDTATVRGDCEHWFRNVGEEDARILLTIFK